MTEKTATSPQDSLNAAILVIGDEILSGRTADTNTNAIVRFLAVLGIDVKEARVVADDEDDIIAAVNALRARYTYVFTTGGIGPTHDDITADAIAKAFDVSIDYHPEALAMLGAHYKPGEFTDSRKRMARIPDTATLIPNAVSTAPGFQIGNVFVMAGVPAVMKAMLDELVPRLARGIVVTTATIKAKIGEGRIAKALGVAQRNHNSVSIGSYPYYDESGFGVQIVVRGRDADAVEDAAKAVENAITELGAIPERLCV